MTPQTGPRILLIDDDPEDRSLVALVLERGFPAARIEQVDNAAAFARALSGGPLDLVVTDCRLAWSDGLSILETVRETRPGVPVLALTAERDVELAVAGMKSGFADFLFKSSKGYLRLAEAAREALEKADNERLAARSEPWLETLLDRANVGVFRSTLDERLIESTPALLRLLGVTSVQEVLDIDFPAPYFRSEERDSLLRRLEDGELQAREVEIERADGTKVWLSLTEVLLLDIDGEIVIDVLVQDVTHLRRQRERLEQGLDELERSNAELSRFASVASHELQEPLRMIEKYSAVVAEDYGDKLGKTGREMLDHVVDGASRMQDLIDDLLAFSRISSEGKRFQACDCNTLVDRAIRNLQAVIEESGAEIERQGLPTILGDATQLVQVWQNLISNAVRFRGQESPKIHISASRAEGEWVFSIRDNGRGFDPKEAENIFTIFRRLQPDLPGTGMGLTICKRIVERHGGRIWAESRPNEGAVFYFSVPFGGEDDETGGGTRKRTRRLASPA